MNLLIDYSMLRTLKPSVDELLKCGLHLTGYFYYLSNKTGVACFVFVATISFFIYHLTDWFSISADLTCF